MCICVSLGECMTVFIYQYIYTSLCVSVCVWGGVACFNIKSFSEIDFTDEPFMCYILEFCFSAPTHILTPTIIML